MQKVSGNVLSFPVAHEGWGGDARREQALLSLFRAVSRPVQDALLEVLQEEAAPCEVRKRN